MGGAARGCHRLDPRGRTGCQGAQPGVRWQGAVGTAPGPAGAPSRPDGGIVDWTGRSLPLYRRRGCAG
ncbi:hypothetical protein G6F63_016989 [Rhizopus arrhizus]|nr:hypothetical protein G6F63_016989 [Rhizopus arrhizus]